MKKLTFAFVLLILFGSVSLCAFADDVYTVKTNVEGELLKDKNIYKLNVYLTDIKDETGVALISYSIKYDPSVFKLIKADAKIPELWKDHIDTEMAEDLSHRVNDGEYSWVWVMSLPGNGIKEDGQLALDMEFEVLSESDDTVVNVSAITVGNDNLDIITANSVEIKVDTSKPGSEQIDTDAPAIQPTSPSPSVSADANPPVQSDPGSSVSTTDDSEGGNTVLIVLLSVIGVSAVAACIFVLIKRRK